MHQRYTDDLWPQMHKSISRSIMLKGHVSSDARNLLLYYRIDHTSRLLMGGRGTFREPVPGQAGEWSNLESVVGKLFPQAAAIPIAYRWCGHVAITRDYLPHLHEPAPGLLIDIGCQGRGVGLQTRMGQALAAYIHSGDKAELPVAPSVIKPFPLYGLRRFYVSAVIGWYRFTDRGV